jgi:carbon storage regulator
MLVLTRKVGDVIAIGDNIKIVVMAIKGKQVRLGVQADKNTVVHREEVYQKIQQETRAAMNSDMDATRTAGDLLREAARPSETPPTQEPPRRGPMRFIKPAKTEDDE